MSINPPFQIKTLSSCAEQLSYDASWDFQVDDTAAVDLSGVVFNEEPNFVRIYIDGAAVIERRKGAPGPTADGSEGLAVVGCGGCCGSCEPIELSCQEIDNFAIIATTGNIVFLKIEAYII